MRKYVSVPLLFAGLLLFTSGCKVVRPKPVKFNNSMARANLELAASGKAFFKTFEDFYKTGSTAKLRTSDVRSAYEFEQREIAAYEQLERLASAAGDSRTAQACRANSLDEVAMAATLLNSRLWRDGTSPEPQIAPRG